MPSDPRRATASWYPLEVKLAASRNRDGSADDVVLNERTMHTRLISLCASGAFGTIAVACSLSTAPPPDQDPVEFCADWGKAVCQLSNGPCSFVEGVCATHQTGVCMNFISAAQSGTAHYSQPNAKACIDALSGAYGAGGSTLAIPAATLFAVNMTCSKVFVGTQSSGSPCTGNNDCSGTLVCAVAVGQNQSVCTSSVTPKDAGDVCADPGDECQGNSYCALSGSLPKCVPTPVTGGPCSASVPCGSTDACVSGTCQARGARGAPCSSNSDCAPSAPYCDNYTGGQCADGLAFAPGSFDCNGIAGVGQSDSGAMDAAPGE